MIMLRVGVNWLVPGASHLLNTIADEMEDSSKHSVSRWLPALKQGNPDAVQAVFDRFFNSIVRTAGRYLGNVSRRVADEEDVAMSAFESFCFAAADHGFKKLEDREDLQQLLFAITRQKAVNLLRATSAAKRGGGKVRGESEIDAKPNDSIDSDFDAEDFREIEPEFTFFVSELFDRLSDDILRRVAALRTQGWQISEIAKELQLHERSVSRKVKLIRDSWAKELSP